MNFDELDQIECTNKWQNVIEYMTKKPVTDPLRYNLIGLMLLHGKGHHKDIPSAIDCFERSAQYGNVSAQLSLADLYEKGKCVRQNLVLSSQFRQEANNDICAICFKLIRPNGTRFKNIVFTVCVGTNVFKKIGKKQLQLKIVCHNALNVDVSL